MESPIKLKAISPCKNVDRLISKLVEKKKAESASPRFLNTFYDPGQKKPNKVKSSTFKTSLADWRSLYHNPRPKTQSLLSASPSHRITSLGFHKKNEKSCEINNKVILSFSPLSTYNKNWESPSSQKGKSGTRTAINFYRSPMREELEALDSLTSRVG